MRNACLFLAVTILVGLAGIVGWLFVHTEPTTVPMVALTPAMPVERSSPARPGDAGPVDATLPPAGDATQRTAAPLAADGALVVVTVTCLDAEARAVPLPFVDVMLEVEGARRDRLASTDAGGHASFEVPAANRLRVAARSSLGGEASAQLLASTTTQLELRITPRAFVQGTITDTGGRGIANAELLLLSWLARPGDTPVPLQIGRSGADGAFHLGLALGGRLGARHPGYGPSPMYLVRLDAPTATPPLVTLQLVLEPNGGRIAGVVVDVDGAPVANAEIEFRSGLRPPRGADLAAAPQRVTSDGSGAFQVEGLRPGPIDYGARAAGHGCQTGQLQLAAGAALSLQIQMPRSCLLTGTVVDEGGRAVRNTRVTAGAPTSFVAQSTLTDAAGHYQLIDLGAGRTQLLAQQQSPSGAALQATAELQLESNRQNEWHATLLPPESTHELRGMIVDRSEQPLAGWSIVARASGRSTAGISLADGTFTLAVPMRMLIDVRAYRPGQALNTFADTVVRGVDPTRGTVRIVADAGEWGQLLGTVSTATLRAIPATITQWHQERAEYVRSTANADGTFVLRVPAGRLDLTFASPSHTPAMRNDVAVAAREDHDLGAISLGAAGILHGAVRGADGRAPEQCQLAIQHKDQRLVADYAGGLYRFDAAPTGEFELQVQGTGFAAATFKVHLGAGEERQLDLDLRAGLLRRIRIQAPPPGVDQIALALRPPDQSIQWMSAQAARPGVGQRLSEAEFEAWMPEGSYEVVAWSGSRYEVRATVQFTAADQSTVNLLLQQK